MGARRSGREAALQMLFQMEASGAHAGEVVALYWRSFEGDPEGQEYANEVVRGVESTLDALDKEISTASTKWRIERMSRVDRNILRLGTWELRNRTDVPRAVILDEAVELAKEFGTEDSRAFVNGVLNKVAEIVGRVDADRPVAGGSVSGGQVGGGQGGGGTGER